jgi:hypothetical protein
MGNHSSSREFVRGARSTRPGLVKVGERQMGLILLIIILVLLFGGGGGYYAYGAYGGTGLGSVLGLILVILIIVWFVRRV